jgi:hypothetical protein
MVDKTYNITTPGYSEWRSQKGGDTPRYLREQGKWSDNSYTRSSGALLRAYSTLAYSNGTPDPSGVSYSINSYYYPSYPGITWPAETDVLSKLSEKWRNTDLNLGMYLSPEGRESVSMMTSSLQKFVNATRSLRRRDFGGFLRNLNEFPRSARRTSARRFNQGDLSGSFLAAHLGWEPLLKDIYTASEGFTEPVRKGRIAARRLGPQRTVRIDGGSSTRPPIGDRKIAVAQKTQVRLILDVTKPPTFTQRFGMENPFLIAWELVPLSFVADYFLPIGSVIENMGFISGTWGMKGWRKTYARLEYKTWLSPGTYCNTDRWNNRLYNRNQISETRIEMEASRTPWKPSFSDPFRSIRTKLPQSVMKLSTLAALAHQNVLALRR